ncbi:peptide transporter [Actinoplanes ianthinogenes]|uniref:Peptide transporter n=1 Tax=Actinoplanes ianthinogenes TaxID=122358 RepID=A0ABN6CTE4_9ACTN|nr:oligopeptide:H+ symporter [Actinoplanes ianthinogenes]BCJ47989.1 peptide transporter [Actinoplanes ianthinogenes]GGR05604.1 peptide transporter [Actinoplanes ianthinogenes]
MSGRLGPLFVLDMCERFSFFGLAATLVLYLVAGDGPGLPATQAAAVFGAYVSVSFLSGGPGGWVADRLLGPRAAALTGGTLIACGHLLLAATALYAGLLCLAAGTGLLKPATAALVAELPSGRTRTASLYSVFYVSIQFSAIAGPLVAGLAADRAGWTVAFAAPAVVMVAGLIIFATGAVPAHGPQRPLAPEEVRRLGWRVAAGIGLLAVLLAVAPMLIVLGLITVAAPFVDLGLLRRAVAADPAARRRLTSLAWLLGASSAYWAIFAQGSSALALFARDHTDRVAAGFTVPAAWLQALHPALVLVLAPLYAAMRRRRDIPRRPARSFAAALAAAGASFVLLAVAQVQAAAGPVPAWWLGGVYLLQAAGELVVGPLGLALTARLAPPGLTARYLGLYGLFAALGALAGNRLYLLTSVVAPETYFAGCGLAVAAVGAALLVPGADRRAPVTALPERVRNG